MPSPLSILPPPVVAFVPSRRTVTLQQAWARFKRRVGTSSVSDSLEPSADSSSEDGRLSRRGSFGPGLDGAKAAPGENEKDEGFDVVVVEVEGSPEGWRKETSMEAHISSTDGGTQEPSGTGRRRPDGSDHTTAIDEGKRKLTGLVAACAKSRVWRVLVNFFSPTFTEDEIEEAFQREAWASHKSTMLVGSCFLVFSALLQIALLNRPWSRWNEVSNYGLGPGLSVPLVVMVILDWPRRHKWFWQVWLWFAIYTTACAQVIDMKQCGSTAWPILSLFALGQRRHLALLGCTVFLVFCCVAIVPQRISFIRNVVNWALFQVFVLWFHYRREINDRHLFTLRRELKAQFRAKQRALINERRTMDAKRRFTNYLFHELRVPLQVASLAVQNLIGDNVFDKGDPEHGVEYSALEGSLRSMSTVLNDVLDYARMERGGFSSVNRPFSFHHTMHSIIDPLQLDATARGLQLVLNVDTTIDEVAVRASLPKDLASQSIGQIDEGKGIVVGDELRLRQLLNNLTSNALKFTPTGGKVTVSTKLVYPLPQRPMESPALAGSPDSDHSDRTLYPSRNSDEEITNNPTSRTAVIRIEVADTGFGIHSRDMVDNRLFSPYVQSAVGISQGGKGTGLGLSLTRQIVTLTGGRLGVRSKIGHGSTFWCEIPYSIGPETRELVDIDFARVSENIGKALATPTTYADDKSEYSFASSRLGNAVTPSAFTANEKMLGIVDEKVEDVDTLHRTQSGSHPSSTFALSMPILPRRGSVSSTTPSEKSYSLAPDVSHASGATKPPPSALASPEPRPRFTPALPSTSSGYSSPSTPPSASRDLHLAGGPLRVLAVDDDALTRKLVGRMLTRLGCQVETAENGALALDLILGEKTPGVPSDNFDVVFLDNQMPICTGVEAVTRLRALGRTDYVVGVTANASSDDQSEYVNAGVSCVLTKPVKEADLKRVLGIAEELRAARAPMADLDGLSQNARGGLPYQ